MGLNIKTSSPCEDVVKIASSDPALAIPTICSPAGSLRVEASSCGGGGASELVAGVGGGLNLE